MGLLRRSLAVISPAALAALWVVTCQATSGAHRLPARIATHFDAAGRANGWGEPRMLWLLPIIAAFVFALMTLASLFPQSFHYPVPTTPATLPRLQAISLSMVAWLRAEVTGLLLWIQCVIIRAARDGEDRLSPLSMPLVTGIIFATILVHIAAMVRAAREDARS